jgi:hypothetical protein
MRTLGVTLVAVLVGGCVAGVLTSKRSTVT